MAYTKFGEFTRILRIKRHEVMGDMAKKLNVTVPFLSAVENGKKNVPTNWLNLLTESYDLCQAQQEELAEAIESSKTQYKISAVNASNTQRQAAMQFARSFEGIDDETAEKIIALLNKQGGDS